MAKSLPMITEEEYHDAVEQSQGWCKKCKEFTRDETEPDAQDYNCPKCEENTVVGAEDALLEGLFGFKEDNDE